MAIRYIGKWGRSPNGDSPTLWVDEETGDYFMQGYRVEDPDVRAELLATADRDRIPAQETLIRFPADMAALFHDLVHEVTAQGAQIRRVRIVSEPESDYVRFEYATTASHADAADEVRWVPRPRVSDHPLSGDGRWIADGTPEPYGHLGGDGEGVAPDATEPGTPGTDPAVDPAVARLIGTALERGIDRPEYTP